jgi:stress response protein SCP2
MKTLYNKLALTLALILLAGVSFAQNVLVDAKKNYPNIKKIEVDGGWLEVSYQGGSGSAVEVEAYLESNDSDQDIIFVTIGDVLKITHERKQNNYNWNTKNKGYIRITGPASIALDLKSGSGSMKVANVSNESTSMKVSSGSISATDIKGDLSIRASSGSLKIDGVQGNVVAGVTSGSAEILNVKGKVDYESTSGSLTADQISGELSVALTSGNAKLTNIGTLGSLKFTSGNIRAENSGLGPNTRLNGTSGNFRIQTPSDLKAFNFSLSASSGNLKVGGTNTGKNLEIDNGASSWVRGSVSSGNITIEN